MKLSLSARAFVAVAAINLVVFGAAALVLFQRAADLYGTQESRVRDQMRFLPQAALRPDSNDVNVARILSWPSWSFACSDAVLIDRSGSYRADGTWRPTGVFLNPVGASMRDADFDLDSVLAAILRAMETGTEVVLSGNARAVPIEGNEGVWGGLWFRQPRPFALWSMLRSLVPWFLGSTVLLTGATFLMLRRYVLDPVERLATAARQVRAGDLSTRLTDRGGSDEVSELVRSFNDMTATVQGFRQKLEDEVERATGEARRAEAAAMTQRRLAAMGELAAGIAHEINNPLGGLSNAARALAADELPPGRRERYLDLLSDGLERIRETVQKLLRFTPRHTDPIPVNLGEVALDALELVRHRAQAASVSLTLRLPGGVEIEPGKSRPPAFDTLPAVSGERNELGQAVLNLLVNAVDALEAQPESERGGVELSLDVAGEEIMLCVQDDGPGVPPETLERVADLFFTTKEVDKGSGLGLALVHNVVETHQGRVILSSESGRGFRAELWFPVLSPGT